MSFLETIEKARAFLERNERVSLRALQREFGLDAEDLDELIEELVDIQRVAVQDGGTLTLAARPNPTSGGVAPAAATPQNNGLRRLSSFGQCEGRVCREEFGHPAKNESQRRRGNTIQLR